MRFLLSVALVTAFLSAATPAFAAPPELMLSCWEQIPGNRQPPLDTAVVVYPDQNLLTMDTGTGRARMHLQQFSETMITANDNLALVSINRLSGSLHFTLNTTGLTGKVTDFYGQCRAVSKPAF